MDANNEIRTEYTLDNSSVLNGLTQVRDSMVEVSNSSQELQGALSSGLSDTKSIETLTKSINDLSDNITTATDDTEKLNKENKKSQEQVKKNSKTMNAFGRSLSVTGGKGRSLGRVLRLLAATPLLATITLIVGGFAFLIKRFASTEAGANKLEKITTVLSSVFGFLADKVIDMGVELVAAFENPKEAIGSLLTAIKTRLIAVVKNVGKVFIGLGEIIASSLSFDKEGITRGSEKMKTAAAEIGKAFLPVSDGVNALKQELEKAAAEAKAIATAAAAAAEQLQRVESKERSLAKSRAELNTRLVQAKAIATDTNKTLQERLLAIKQIEAAEASQLKKEIRNQSQKIKAIRQINSLNKSSKADLDKLNQAEVQLANLRTQSAQRLLAFQERKKALEAEALEAAKRAVDLENEIRLSLIKDEEERAIAAAKKDNQILQERIKSTIKDESKKAALLIAIEKNLQDKIQEIQAAADKRKETERQNRTNKIVQDELSKLEVITQIKRFELLTKQELERQEFAQVARSADEIKKFKRNQSIDIAKLELDSQAKRLETVKKFNKDLTAEQKRQIDAELSLIKTQLKGVGTVIEQSEDGDKKRKIGSFINAEAQAVISASQQALGAIKASVEKRQKLLQDDINARNNRIKELEKQLEQELALAEQGKNNKVEQVREELEAEKSARHKAEQEKQEAAFASFALDSLIQGSNLVTAISSLYASLASLPFGAGVGIATALSAVMVGAFIASKAQVAAAAGFYKGGDTGNGNPLEESTRLGERPYTYHKSEFVLPHKVYRRFDLAGKPVSYVEGLLELGQHKQNDSGILNLPDFSPIEFKMQKVDNRTNTSRNIKGNQSTHNLGYNNEIVNLLKKIVNKPEYHYADGKVIKIQNNNRIIKNH